MAVFASGRAVAARSDILNMARAQLDKLMQTCDRRPSDEILATAEPSLEGGQMISVPTGMTQKAFAERLENIIIRFQYVPSPDQEEIDLANSFRKMSGQEKQAFWTALEHNPAGGKKARSLAIQCLYERGVDDYATLSLANRLTKNEAIAFARSCLLVSLHDTPDQIRISQLITSFAARQSAEAPDDDKAYGGLRAFKIDVNRPTNGYRILENDAPVPGLPIPANPVIGDPILKDDDVRFTFRFPDGQTLFSVAGAAVDPNVIQNTNAIAQKIEKLCGSVHQKQLANVYYLLAQNGEMPNVCSGFMDQKVHCMEHTALKYSFSKDALTQSRRRSPDGRSLTGKRENV